LIQITQADTKLYLTLYMRLRAVTVVSSVFVQETSLGDVKDLTLI